VAEGGGGVEVGGAGVVVGGVVGGGDWVFWCQWGEGEVVEVWVGALVGREEGGGGAGESGGGGG
jgi:hypothetical protein